MRSGDTRQALAEQRQRLVAESASVRRKVALAMVAMTAVIIVGSSLIFLLVRAQRTLSRLDEQVEAHTAALEDIEYRASILMDDNYRDSAPRELVLAYELEFTSLFEEEQQLSADIHRTVEQLRGPLMRWFSFVHDGEIGEFESYRVDPVLLGIAEGVPSRLVADPDASLSNEELRLRNSISTREFIQPLEYRARLVRALVIDGDAAFHRALLLALGVSVLGLGAVWVVAFSPSLRALRDLTGALDEHAAEIEYGYLQVAAAQRVARLGYWSKPGADAELTCSERMLEMFDLTPAHAPRDLDQLASLARSPDGSARDIYARLAESPGARDFTRTVLGSDGVVRTLRERVESFESAGGIEMMGVVLDISELTEAQQMKARLERFETIELLISGIAHDFNNQLSIVLGNAEVALLDPADPKPRLRAIVSACESAAEVIAQLRQSTMDSSTVGSIFRPADVVREVVDTIAPLPERRVQVVVEIEPGAADVAITANQLLFENAIVNLVSNATEAIERADGQVRIVVAHETGSDPVGWGPESGPWVTISVIDNGSGMSAEVRDRALQPFFSTKKVVGATNMGLGLWSVYAFAKAWNGSIEIDSTEGIGTAMLLRFPAVAPTVAAAQQEPVGGASLTGTAVLVDDIPEVLDTVATLLRGQGLEVVPCASFVDAEREIRSRRDLDLLVTDVHLGAGGGGFDLAREALDFRPDLPIVLVSGSLDASDVPDSIRVANCIFLAKPFTSHDLEAAIARASAPLAVADVS